MRDKIINLLKNIDEEIVNYNGDDMISDGIIDSFKIIDIVSTLEGAFDVEIDPTIITRTCFMNKDTIVDMMLKVIERGNH